MCPVFGFLVILSLAHPILGPLVILSLAPWSSFLGLQVILFLSLWLASRSSCPWSPGRPLGHPVFGPLAILSLASQPLWVGSFLPTAGPTQCTQ